MDEWKAWLEPTLTSPRFLWIHGIPGAGKTILASFLINQVQSNFPEQNCERVSCIYYYCSFRNNIDQDEVIPLLRWTVSQLCRKTGSVPQSILDLYQSNTTPDMPSLRKALTAMLTKMDKVYLMVDAIDESNPRESLLELLADITIDPLFRKIQLFATSRRYADIESAFKAVSSPISMCNPVVDEDIRRYVSSEIKKKFASWPQSLQDEVLQALVVGAKGM